MAVLDGSVTLAMPVNERVPRRRYPSQPITSVDITVDPARATTDLREIRAATKQALIRHQEVSDERWALSPLVPLVPERLGQRMLLGVAAGGATSVVASNLGVVNPAANRADGTDADYFAMKSHFPGVTRAMVHRSGGRWPCFREQCMGGSSSRSLHISPADATRMSTCDMTFRAR